MRIGSLFSGAGGLDLAALELFPGASMAWHCEVQPSAAKVLAHHWPDVPNLGDVTQVDWAAIEPVDVLTGGFPCQDVSTAGRRAGLADGTRSGLWSHMRDAIAAMRPRWVLVENVKGLLSAPAIRRVESEDADLGYVGSGPVLRALGAVLGDLAGLGFDADWTCVRASQVGACHRRERVFVLAYPADAGSSAVGEYAGEPSPEEAGAQASYRSGNSDRERIARDRRAAADGVGTLLPTPSVADGTGGHASRSGARSDELLLPGLARAHAEGALLPTPRTTDANGAGAHGTGGEDLRTTATGSRWGVFGPAIAHQEALSRPAPSPTEPNANGRPRLNAAFAEWMMFWPKGWVTDPAIGLSRVDQLRAIGNGVVPPQAVAAFSYLLTLSEVAA